MGIKRGMTILFSKKKSFIALLFVMLFIITFNSACNKNKNVVEPTPEYSTVTDIEGNVYKTVKIGNQWWMAENLKVKKYNNGTAINEIQADTSTWRKDTLGAYSKIENSNPKIDYGLLYNWHAVNNADELAPEGWHIPTDAEWKELEAHLGMNAEQLNKTGWRGNNEAELIKIENDKNWAEYGDVWQTNKTGFTALAGACKVFNGTWGYPGIRNTGYWWTSSTNNNQAWYRHLNYKNKNIFRYHCLKSYGYSVRCVKN